MAEKGDRIGPVINPDYLRHSYSNQQQLRDATKALIFAGIHAYGREQGADVDWYTRAETYATYLVTGSPYGRIAIEEEVKQLVRGFFTQACAETGFKRKAANPSSPKKRKRR